MAAGIYRQAFYFVKVLRQSGAARHCSCNSSTLAWIGALIRGHTMRVLLQRILRAAFFDVGLAFFARSRSYLSARTVASTGRIQTVAVNRTD